MCGCDGAAELYDGGRSGSTAFVLLSLAIALPNCTVPRPSMANGIAAVIVSGIA